MDILLSSIVAGLLLGMVLAIVALGLTIIFGVMDIVNFAHGEFLMIGMYTGLLTAQAMGIDPLLTLPFAAIVGFLVGVLCYTGFVKFLLRGPMIAQLLGTFGLMLLLRNLALLIFGSEDRALHHGILVGKSFDIGMGVILPATKVAAVSCNRCGGTLDVTARTNYTTCGYCGTRLRVERSASSIATVELDELRSRTDDLERNVTALRDDRRVEQLDRKWEARRAELSISS